MKRVFFVDFDGTITKEDVCAAMVEAFAGDGWREINDLWEKKLLSTRDCANMIFKLFNAGLNEIKSLVETMEIDEYFKDFLALCRNQGYKVHVLSDGYDFYIETIFKNYGIDVSYYANRLVYNGGFEIDTPYHNPACGQCGTCKKTLMSKLRENAEEVIFIGDGYSDTCPAQNADFVFAKGVLYNYCLEKGVSVQYYDSFKDIIRRVTLSNPESRLR
ncbi:MAG TPA: MtnX-like HAD-IB family phosphatase [Bacillota bacterium]|jgi:2,3-diketo-5-methylthio-1-phosphopentane phosphatase|nr:MtnX-like HAD-IB family phosphatase [Peptococcaceae bacterium MAG4]NLW38790.1 MtnX-like HAD-IB family phosphatase [Peptococcaceae bacterium]HPZ44378.1 MtnX-like HAD-IB family phosphatase [Bacillota bacterium]HQD77024.1 MtnX-like HAD-IB family phosphatase [Bacillota bacterium]HUM59706.1 MtnX-like HAD-IB family phosphatase [Bacillota bacterium]